jgi:hypothetical protein
MGTTGLIITPQARPHQCSGASPNQPPAAALLLSVQVRVGFHTIVRRGRSTMYMGHGT